MATIRIATSVKNSMLTVLRDAIDAGTAGGMIKLYSGSMPNTPETNVTSQVLLGTLVCSAVCGTVANGVLTFNTITPDAQADASGTATWARIADSDGVAVIDCDVTVTTGTGALKINTTTIIINGPISAASLTMALP